MGQHGGLGTCIITTVSRFSQVLHVDDDGTMLAYERPLSAEAADADLAARVAAYRAGLHEQVVAKDARLQQLGSHAYLQQMG